MNITSQALKRGLSPTHGIRLGLSLSEICPNLQSVDTQLFSGGPEIAVLGVPVLTRRQGV